MVCDEGKERLMPQEELACTENMISKNEENSSKRPLVELSEADSTVTNGFDAAESQQQKDGAPPFKKQHLIESNDETNDDHSSNDASSTTSSPHEIVSNFHY